MKDHLLRAVDADTEAFNSVLTAMRLPKGSAAERKLREAAIEAGTQHATEVPLRSAELCLDALRLCRRAAERGLPAGITDAGVGALLARAGLEGALYNVQVNLAGVRDREWARRVETEVERIRLSGAALADETAHLVTSALSRGDE